MSYLAAFADDSALFDKYSHVYGLFSQGGYLINILIRLGQTTENTVGVVIYSP
jgi:hypothetical protein